MSPREELTAEEMESLRWLRDGIARFAGRSGTIKIGTDVEAPLLVKAIDALSEPVKAARPEGEAVAWRWRKVGDPEWQFFSRGEYPPLSPPAGYESEPLYTTPQTGLATGPTNKPLPPVPPPSGER